MSDRSTLALYFAAPGAVPVATREGADETLAAGTRVLAVYPAAAAAGSTVTIDATAPDGVVRRVLEFKPQRGWERRYFLDEPMDLPKGTMLQTSVKFERTPAQPVAGPMVILNTVPER
jgi:hypothetical protein